MNNEIQTEQILDDYVLGKIPLQEAKILLRNESVSNIEEAINLHQIATIALQRNATIVQVKYIHNQFIASRPAIVMHSTEYDTTKINKVKKMNPLKWVARIAAVIVVLISSWYAYEINASSSTKLYSELYQPYNVNTDRATISEMMPHNMIKHYKEKDYNAVINTYLTLGVTNNREKFLTAIAYHEKGNYKEAIYLFSKILKENREKGTRLYNDEAEYYSGLTYLKMNDGGLAYQSFITIYNTPNHTFHDNINKWTITKLKWIK